MTRQPHRLDFGAHSEEVRHIITPKPGTPHCSASFAVSICVEGVAKLWDIGHLGSDAVTTFQNVRYGTGQASENKWALI